MGHVVHGCWFESNGLAADNTYSDIRCTDTAGASLVGNTFRWTGSGNRPKYLVEFTGVTLPLKWAGNTFDALVNVPYATALTNTEANLKLDAPSLEVTGTATLGGASGSQSLQVAAGVAAGNYVQVSGKAAGVPPEVQAQGADTNVNLRLVSKGSGSVDAYSNGLRAIRFNGVSSAVNFADVYNSATGNAVQFLASGTDANIDLSLVPKGTGVVRMGAHTANPDAPITGYITIKDSGGTVRKLAVIT